MRPFREALWDPQPGDEHVLYLGLRWRGVMRVLVVEPHRIVTEEKHGLRGTPVARFFAHGEAFAQAYRVSADPYAVLYGPAGD